MKPTVIHQNNRFLPAIIKGNGKTKILLVAFYGEEAALAVAQRKIDRLKNKQKEKKKALTVHYAPICVCPYVQEDDSILFSVSVIHEGKRVILFDVLKGSPWRLFKDGGGCVPMPFPTYQEAYQAGHDYLKSL